MIYSSALRVALVILGDSAKPFPDPPSRFCAHWVCCDRCLAAICFSSAAEIHRSFKRRCLSSNTEREGKGDNGWRHTENISVFCIFLDVNLRQFCMFGNIIACDATTILDNDCARALTHLKGSRYIRRANIDRSLLPSSMEGARRDGRKQHTHFPFYFSFLSLLSRSLLSHVSPQPEIERDELTLYVLRRLLLLLLLDGHFSREI